MSTETLNQRPIFASEEQNLLTPTRPPISRLAIGSMVFGVASSIALFNIDLVAMPVLATTFGLAAFLLTAKNEAVRGQTLALLGMALGIAFGVACYTSTQKRDQYLYLSGTKAADQLLTVLGQNKLLEAYELTRAERDRQVAGASLEEAYARANQTAKENIDAFKQETGVQKIVALGPNAKWKLHSGVRILEVQGTSVHVVLRMIEEKSQKTAEVTLNRDYLNGIAAWHVVSVK